MLDSSTVESATPRSCSLRDVHGLWQQSARYAHYRIHLSQVLLSAWCSRSMTARCSDSTARNPPLSSLVVCCLHGCSSFRVPRCSTRAPWNPHSRSCSLRDVHRLWQRSARLVQHGILSQVLLSACRSSNRQQGARPVQHGVLHSQGLLSAWCSWSMTARCSICTLQNPPFSGLGVCVMFMVYDSKVLGYQSINQYCIVTSVHTDRNHEHNKGSIVSDTIQAMPSTFAVQIVRLKVHMTIAGPMTLTFIQGHKCVSNLATFLTYNISDNNYVSYYSQTWHEGSRSRLCKQNGSEQY